MIGCVMIRCTDDCQHLTTLTNCCCWMSFSFSRSTLRFSSRAFIWSIKLSSKAILAGSLGVLLQGGDTRGGGRGKGGGGRGGGGEEQEEEEEEEEEEVVEWGNRW